VNRLSLKEAMRVAVLPLLVLLSLIVFVIVYQALGLPNSDELVKLSEKYLTRYGYLIVFVAAFVETIPPINFYFPGSAVVVLSVAFCRSGTMNVLLVLSVTAIAFLLAYILDYFVGKWGWLWLLTRFGFGPALERSQQRVQARGPAWLWWANVHPNIGAIAATSCGVLRIPFSRFLLHSIGATVLWVALWGFIAFIFGQEMVKFLDIRLLIPLAFLWLVLTLRKRFKRVRQ
jgi:membrane protein DedA with SNARE-associated domain